MALQRATHAIWLAEAEAQLDAIEGMKAGWDSHGAAAPDPELVRAGRDLLESLATESRIPKPHVNPTPSGGIQFDWESDSRCFEIEIVGPDRMIALYQDLVAKKEREWERSTALPPDDLLDHIRMVAGTHF